MSRGESARTETDRLLREKIEAIHRNSRGIYGSPRVHASLREQQIHVSKKRVARLMRELGIVGRVMRVTRRNQGKRVL